MTTADMTICNLCNLPRRSTHLERHKKTCRKFINVDLRDLYIVQGWSTVDIAKKITGVGQQTVTNRLREIGIEVRNRHNRYRGRKHRQPVALSILRPALVTKTQGCARCPELVCCKLMGPHDVVACEALAEIDLKQFEDGKSKTLDSLVQKVYT